MYRSWPAEREGVSGTLYSSCPAAGKRGWLAVVGLAKDEEEGGNRRIGRGLDRKKTIPGPRLFLVKIADT